MAQRDQLEVDVLFVGAGPASLAGAIRLGQLAKAAGRELEILVIEKAAEIGNHGLSGLVLDMTNFATFIDSTNDQGERQSPAVRGRGDRAPG